MANEEHRNKPVFVGDSAPTNRLGEALLKKSVPTQALATALSKVPVAAPTTTPSPVTPATPQSPPVKP